MSYPNTPDPRNPQGGQADPEGPFRFCKDKKAQVRLLLAHVNPGEFRGDFQIMANNGTFMIRVILALLIAVFSAPAAFSQAKSPGAFFVTANTLNVRLAANTMGSVASKLHRGQEVEVFEIANGWARISEYFDGGSEGLSGKVARWVSATHLSAKPPTPKKIDGNSSIVWAIGASDDLAKHQDAFVQVSKILVDSGECKISDFRDIGGWWRSAAHKPRPIYYTYCGGASNSHRIFVDITTGQTFR
jgi:hypothetical protein